jgi:hypothetical protein
MPLGNIVPLERIAAAPDRSGKGRDSTSPFALPFHLQKKFRLLNLSRMAENWSEKEDSNLRPLPPEHVDWQLIAGISVTSGIPYDAHNSTGLHAPFEERFKLNFEPLSLQYASFGGIKRPRTGRTQQTKTAGRAATLRSGNIDSCGAIPFTYDIAESRASAKMVGGEA